MENKNFNFCLKVPDKILFSVPQNIEFFKNFNFCLKVPDEISFSIPQNIELFKITIRTLRCIGQPHQSGRAMLPPRH